MHTHFSSTYQLIASLYCSSGTALILRHEKHQSMSSFQKKNSCNLSFRHKIFSIGATRQLVQAWRLPLDLQDYSLYFLFGNPDRELFLPWVWSPCSLPQTDYPLLKLSRDCTYTHLIEGICMQFNWSWMHFFLLCGKNQRLASCMFLCRFQWGVGNHAVLIHNLLRIPRLCQSCEQLTSHRSAKSKLWITSVLLFSISCILSSFLENTHMGLHLLSLSILYTARVYECYFTDIAICIYSQSNLVLQH